MAPITGRITDLWKRGRRFLAKHRTQAVAAGVALVFLAAGVTAWALSDRGEKPKRPAAHASSNVSKTAKPAARTAKADPLAAGIRLYEQKKYDAAIQSFQPLVGEHVEARFWLGKSHLAEGHAFRGCRQLRLYVEKAPQGRYVRAAKRDLQGC